MNDYIQQRRIGDYRFTSFLFVLTYKKPHHHYVFCIEHELLRSIEVKTRPYVLRGLDDRGHFYTTLYMYINLL